MIGVIFVVLKIIKLAIFQNNLEKDDLYQINNQL